MVLAFRRMGFVQRDSPTELGYVAAFFVGYAVLDRLVAATARLGAADVADAALAPAAIVANPIGTALLVVAGVALAIRGGDRLLAPWPALEHGASLRWLIAVPVALLAWQGALYSTNYLVGRTHLFDRSLLVVLAVGALWRPALLVPFALQFRVIAAQFAIPFGTTAAQNIDELLVIAVLVVAAAHLIWVATARVDTAPVVLVLAAALATHFFVPGRGKVLIGWLFDEDLGNLAANANTVGWLGQTDGSFVLDLVAFAAALGPVLRVGTVLFELGAAVVAVHHRWFRWWLPGAIVFHAFNFLYLGFWFGGWILFEVALLVLVTRPGLRPWLERNLSLGRAVVTGGAIVIAGPLLFHPPGLAWLDSPVSYGYRIDAVGSSGTVYAVPLDEFAPFDQELAFTRLLFGPRHDLTGAYGVVADTDRLAELSTLTDLDAVAALERPVTAEDEVAVARTEALLRAFVVDANRRVNAPNVVDRLAPVAPVSKYWTGRDGEPYRYQERIERLEVVRVTGLRVDDRLLREQGPVHVVSP